MRYLTILLLALFGISCSSGVAQYEGQIADYDKRLDDVEARLGLLERETEEQSSRGKQQSAEIKLALANIDQLIARVESMTRDLEQRQQDVAALLDDLTSRVIRLERTSMAEGDSAAPLVDATAKEVYDRARMDLDAGHLELAAIGFRSFIEQYPNSVLADDAQFMIGESHYASDEFQLAIDAYGQLLDAFSASDRRALAMLRIGYSLFQLNRNDEAESMLKRLMEEYPGSKEAIAARERLSTIR